MTQPESSYPARWWHTLDDGRIQCDLCPRDCRLHEGQRGACFVPCLSAAGGFTTPSDAGQENGSGNSRPEVVVGAQ